MMVLTVRQNLVSKSKWHIKCPNIMNPTTITIHNTANDASAVNEINYMINNSNEVSFHYAVDDKEVIQGIPLDRNTWHAGDGHGDGNRKSISIEICYSKSGGIKFIQAEKNAAIFIAMLLKERNWGTNKLKKHQDWNGKYCPHRTLDMGWHRFITMVQTELNKLSSKNTSTDSSSNSNSNTSNNNTSKEKYKVGDIVTLNGYLYTTSNATGRVSTGVKSGKITKIITGNKAPYLIGNGVGWLDNAGIKSNSSTTDNKSYSAGAQLTLNNVALFTNSTTNTKASTKKGIFYLWDNQVVNNRMRITNSRSNVGKVGQVTGWVNKSDIKLI